MRSPAQVREYEALLAELARVLVETERPMTAAEIRRALGWTGKNKCSPATLYARIEALGKRGYRVEESKIPHVGSIAYVRTYRARVEKRKTA